uniref:NADH:flavin oxidoreductase/NADH oxidase N-terminal domain-containing protein n=1 Tax=Kalanchoe fedtschenkoi TaxID=63787 RepID=A0A7N0SWU5_KALFE
MALEGMDTAPSLFSPLQIGKIQLSHRIVFGSVTQVRAPNGLPNGTMKEHYSRRATPGGLLISEGNAISNRATGYPDVPGIYEDEQVRAWRPIVEAVHVKGGFIFCQLWHVGRASHSAYQPGGTKPISSTNKGLPDKFKVMLPDRSLDSHSEPRALSVDEIPEIVEQFRRGALNVIKAGFDGVEIHAGHGYLIDQFLKDNINDRTDHYGGSLSNRMRFLFDVVDAVVSALGGPERVAVRISPAINHLDATDSNPLGLGLAIVDELNKRQLKWGAKLAYLHVTHPHFREYLATNSAMKGLEEADAGLMRELRNAYRGTFMCTGGYTREIAAQVVARGEADLISFGRMFMANPDLVERLRINAPLRNYDLPTFFISNVSMQSRL